MIAFNLEFTKSLWQHVRDYLFGRPAPVRVRSARSRA